MLFASVFVYFLKMSLELAIRHGAYLLSFLGQPIEAFYTKLVACMHSVLPRLL